MDITTNRNEKFDFIKGLLILGVVWEHMITALKCDSDTSFWIHSFMRIYDMPMFAFITGYFLYSSCKKREWHKNILNKIRNIFWPVVLWCLIFNIIERTPILYYKRFWYLWSILFAAIVVILINKICKNNLILNISAVVIAVIFFHTVTQEFFFIGFLLPPCLFGYYIAKLNMSEMNSKISFMIIILFVILSFFWNGKCSVWEIGCNIFAQDNPYIAALQMLYRCLMGMLGCLAMYNVYSVLYGIFLKSKILKKMVKSVILWGQNTLEIYILQSFFVEYCVANVVRKMFLILNKNIFMFNPYVMAYVIAFVFSVIAIIAMVFVVKLLKKIPVVGKHFFAL